jgi:hypothetical protein
VTTTHQNAIFAICFTAKVSYELIDICCMALEMKHGNGQTELLHCAFSLYASCKEYVRTAGIQLILVNEIVFPHTPYYQIRQVHNYFRAITGEHPASYPISIEVECSERETDTCIHPRAVVCVLGIVYT